MNATYTQTFDHYSRQRVTQLRDRLREEFGTRKYRIVGLGLDTEIHVHGRMPNSIETGWYLLGYIRDVEARYSL